MTELRAETPNQTQPTTHNNTSLAAPFALTPDTPRIYVACLAAYNNGHLHGAWIDVEDEESIQDAVCGILKTSPIPNAEEWAIHDYENFDGVTINEYDSFARVVEIAEFIGNCSGFGGKLLENYGGDIEDAESALERYNGEYESLADFAEELTESTTKIPKTLKYYIDYKSMARDMEMNGDVFTIETGYKEIHVFWNN
ncbi:MAG: antirestriction protein [Alphaproteobacteria bacterium]|nr:MAG: antirestriction protein [Alphaproteobacteria bacterium]